MSLGEINKINKNQHSGTKFPYLWLTLRLLIPALVLFLIIYFVARAEGGVKMTWDHSQNGSTLNHHSNLLLFSIDITMLH